MTDRIPHPQLVRLDRRIVWALFFEHAVRAAILLAALAGTVVLVARVGFGAHWPPQWSWLWIGLAVSFAWGAMSATRGRFSQSGLATWIDRRQQLGGLLVTALERPAGEWDDTLDARIRASQDALPTLRPARWGLPVVGIAAFFWLLTLLPMPQRGRAQDSLIAQQLDRVAEDVELALEAGAIAETEAEELRERVGEMQQMLDEGLEVAWSDADGLGERLEHDESVRLDRLASLRSEIGEFQGAADKASPGAQQSLLDALEHADSLGLEGTLDAELAALAQKIAAAQDAAAASAGTQGAGQEGVVGEGLEDMGAMAVDLTKLGFDAAALERLVKGLEQASDARLAQLEGAGKLDPGQLEDLSKILEEARAGC